MRLTPRLALLGLLVLAGCGDAEGGKVTAPPPELVASGPRSAADPCGAAPLQRLVGRRWAEVEVRHYRGGMRVHTVDEPVTEELNRERLNVVITPDRQTIAGVWCG